MVSRHRLSRLVTWAMLTIWRLEIRSKFIVFFKKNIRVHENYSELKVFFSIMGRQAERARELGCEIYLEKELDGLICGRSGPRR